MPEEDRSVCMQSNKPLTYSQTITFAGVDDWYYKGRGRPYKSERIGPKNVFLLLEDWVVKYTEKMVVEEARAFFKRKFKEFSTDPKNKNPLNRTLYKIYELFQEIYINTILACLLEDPIAMEITKDWSAVEKLDFAESCVFTYRFFMKVDEIRDDLKNNPSKLEDEPLISEDKSRSSIIGFVKKIIN